MPEINKNTSQNTVRSFTLCVDNPDLKSFRLYRNDNSIQTSSDNLMLFKNFKVLTVAAMFVALSIVLGKVLSITAGAYRISFENLSVLMAGIYFGPVIGMTVGVLADIIGCFCVGYTINPLITLGAAAIGFTSGFMRFYILRGKSPVKLAVAISTAHFLGSVLIKSYGMYVYFGYMMPYLIWRLPIYAAIAAAESAIVIILDKNKGFVRLIKSIRENGAKRYKGKPPKKRNKK